MSHKTIDERVVEMRFDNQQFEKNVQESLSTLDKLKRALRLDGAAKSFEKLERSSNRFGMNGLSGAVDTVRAKFSALEVVGVTALANITNSAVNTGKQIVKALTIDPIKSGFQEYETQINAVQTILANTSSKGTTLEQVNAALDELNHYADMTIYNFTEMTRNIGTFTAAGVDLETSVSAIKGIANLAAVSGSTSQQASTAMYQLSQALAAGTVKLMDWNSVVNAGMGGQVFQDALMDTARVHGIAIDQMIQDEGSFRETLSKGWLSSDILTETLQKFTGDLSRAQLVEQGYTEQQIDAIMEMGQTANDAATKVKTFTQLVDTLKEAAQSGWTETWETIVGDFEEAKGLWTKISDELSAMIGASANARNELVSGALDSGWSNFLKEGITDAVGFKECIVSAAKAHSVAIEEMAQGTEKFEDSLNQGWLTADILSEALTDLTQKTAGLSDAELVQLGMTREQVDDLEKLNQAVRDGTVNLDEYASKIARMSGRDNLIESFWNTWEALFAIPKQAGDVVGVITTVKNAFRDIFPRTTSEQLYAFTEGLREFTEKFKMSGETADKLKRTFKGLFAAMNIITSFVKAGVKTSFEILSSVLGGVVPHILDITASIGDALVSFRDWTHGVGEAVKSGDVFNQACQRISGFINAVVSRIKELVRAINLDFESPGFEWLQNFLDVARERFRQVVDATGEMGAGVRAAIDAMISSLSGSKLFQALQKLCDGAKNLLSAIMTVIGGLASNIAEKLGNADFSGIIDLLNGISFSAIAVGITKFLHSIQQPFDEVGGLLDNVKSILDGVRGCFEAYQSQLKAGILLKIAAAIGILAAAIVAISLIDSEKLSASLGGITVLFADLMGAMAIFGKIGTSINGVIKTCVAMLAVSTSVLILASALKKIADLDAEHLAVGLIGIAGTMAALIASVKVLSDGSAIKGATQMIIFAGAIKILASVCNNLAALSWEQLAKGLTGVGVLLAEVSLFLNTAKFSGKSINTAASIVVLSGAIKILASACNDFGQMDRGEIAKGLVSIGVLLLEIVAFTKLTENAKKTISTGIALIEIAASLKIFASVISSLGSLSWEAIAKGLIAIGGALAEVAIAMNFMPGNMIGLGAGLIGVGAAIGILANSLMKMGGMSWEEIAKGLVALGVSLAELAVGLKLMNGTLAGSAAMLVAAGALAIFTPTLFVLGSMSWESIVKGLVTLAGAFTVIGVAGAVLTPIVPTILGLAGAFALLGVGTLGIGAGLLAISVGLTALATSMGAGVAVIVAGLTSIITGVASVIPVIAEKLGEAVVAFCKVISDGVPTIGEAIKALVLTIIDVLIECVPPLVNGALELISSALSALVSYTPQIVDSIMQFLIKVIEGISQRLPELLQAAMNLIMSFFAGIVDALSGIDTSVLLKGIAGVGLLSVIMVALGALAGLVPSAMAGVLGMGAVIAEIALVLAAIGGLAQIPGISWLIGEGGKILEGIGNAIGSFVGGIVSGFMTSSTSQLPEIGAKLTAFMTNVRPFIDGASSIQPSMLSGVKALTEAILLLTAADILDGLTSWLTGGSSLSDFAEQLVIFGESMSKFSKSIVNVKPGKVTAVANATKVLAEFANNLPNSGGLAEFFSGNNDIDKFGELLDSFGSSFKNYYNSISDIGDPKKITAATAGLQALIDVARGIGNGDAIKEFEKFLADLVKTNLDDFIGAFKDAEPEIKKAGTNLGKNLENGIRASIDDLRKAGQDAAQGFVNGITSKLSSVSNAGTSLGNTAVKSARKALDSHSPSRVFRSIGVDTYGGYVEGITSGLSEIGKASAGMGNASIKALRTAIGAHSNAKKTKEVGKDYAGGYEEGIAKGGKRVDKAVTKLGKDTTSKLKELNNQEWEWIGGPTKQVDETIKETTKGAEKTVQKTSKTASTAAKKTSKVQKAAVKSAYETFEEYMEEERFYNRLSTEEQLNQYKKVLDTYKLSAEERKKAKREVYTLENQLQDETYQASIDWIEEEKYYNRLSLEEELAAWEKVQSKYLEGTEERKKADREVYRLHNELASASYENSMNWIEQEKYYNRMTLSDELAAYLRMQSRYAKGTEERKKLDREVYRLQKEIADAQKQYYSDVQQIQAEASQKRLDLEQQYADKVKAINDQLARDIQAANDEYENAVKSRENTLYRSYGLFDKAADRKDISGSELMANLEGQVKEFGAWQDTLDSLSARGLDDELIAELEEMGPSAISEIKALNSMTDSELKKYAALWSIRHAQAREQAASELEDLRIETQNKIELLRIESAQELDEYRSMWSQEMDELNNETNQKLDDLRKDFGETVGLIKKDTESELREMTESANSILRQAGWDETGKQIVNGLTGGVESQKPSFLSVLKNMAMAGVNAVKNILGIRSPSRVFGEIGNYAGLGFVSALLTYADRSYDAGLQMADAAKEGLANSIQRIADVVNSDIDTDPTIRPVIDLSDVTRGAGEINGLFGSGRSIDLAWRASAGINASISEGKSGITVQNDDVVAELRSLRGEMAAMTERMERTQVVLDTGALVGGMAGPMDAALGQMAIRKGRGN